MYAIRSYYGRIIDECYTTARKLLDDNIDKLHAMADALMQYETIDSDQIDDIMAGRNPRPPADWGDDAGIGGGVQAGTAKPRREDGGKPIGGPAGEH